MSDLIADAEGSVANRATTARLLRWAFGAIIIIGAILRVADAGRPFDHRLSNAWRAADYVQISRNFHRDSLSILYPRVDWNADTPGYVEMELPILPWLAAATGRVVGYHENYMRLIAGACSLLGLVLFSRLARRLLPPLGALLAVSAFAVNPLLVKLGDAMQPEPVMMLGCIATAYMIEGWRRTPTTGRLMLTALLLACAVLAKAPAAAMGLVVAFVIFREQGRKACLKPMNYLAGIVAIAPPLAWTIWASRFWHLYGNSLGLSNESHWIAWRMLTPPEFLWGIFKWESLAVVSPIGWLLVLAAGRFRGRGFDLAWAWYGAAVIFYLIAGGTSGDDWASYYHCLSVPGACLLMGGGFAVLVQSANSLNKRSLTRRPMIGAVVGVGVIGLLAFATSVALYRRDHHAELLEMRRCAIQLANVVPTSGRIIVRGGEAEDELGRPVAYNEPMMFAWMDRRGFNYPRDELSAAMLDRLRKRGGRYWVARADELKHGGLKIVAAEQFKKLAGCTCGGYTVYDINPNADRALADQIANRPGKSSASQ